MEARPEPEPSQKPPRLLGCRAAGAERFTPAKAHEVEVLARALLGVAAALRAVPGQHRQPQLQGCATDWAAERLAAVARKAGRRITLPTIEEEGLLPTSLPLGLALLLVACELALPSRHAKSTTKDTARMNECNHVAARDALRGAWEGIERTRLLYLSKTSIVLLARTQQDVGAILEKQGKTQLDLARRPPRDSLAHTTVHIYQRCPPPAAQSTPNMPCQYSACHSSPPSFGEAPSVN